MQRLIERLLLEYPLQGAACPANLAAHAAANFCTTTMLRASAERKLLLALLPTPLHKHAACDNGASTTAMLLLLLL
jgi:hypothetical protein